MCRRPSRSLNSTVTAFMRFSSVRYLSRCSWILWAATRCLRCSFASRFNSSSSPYESIKKSRNSVDMDLLENLWGVHQPGADLDDYSISEIRIRDGPSLRPIESAYQPHS